jgi:hypothetical protein
VTIIVSLAKLERQRISERTKAGLKRGKQEGKLLGWPRIVVDVQKVRKLQPGGMGLGSIARENGSVTVEHHARIERGVAPRIGDDPLLLPARRGMSWRKIGKEVCVPEGTVWSPCAESCAVKVERMLKQTNGPKNAQPAHRFSSFLRIAENSPLGGKLFFRCAQECTVVASRAVRPKRSHLDVAPVVSACRH